MVAGMGATYDGDMSKTAAARVTGRCHVGVGGWNFPPWRGTFYPADLPRREELAYASRRLSSIEINSTFYGPHRPGSFRLWHEETPDGFVFAVKGPMSVAGRRALREAGEGIERFLRGGVLELREKLGPINWQLPPAMAFDAAEIDAFLRLLPRKMDGRPLRHALEVRNASFRHGEFVALAREHGVAIVVAGDSRFPQIADVTADFVYVRIMGTQSQRAQGYTPAALERWAGRMREWRRGRSPAGLEYMAEATARAGPRDVFLYVISGAKERNPAAALALNRRLASR